MRHDDEVLLRLRRLDAAEADAILARFPSWRLAYRLGDELLRERQRLGPSLGRLRDRMPEAAAYLLHIERRLDALAKTIDRSSESDEVVTPTLVNLSAQGMRCAWEAPFEEGDAVEVGMALLPGYEVVATIGRVIRTAPGEGESPPSVSIDFEHILERDQEALIRHVCRLQRELIALRKIG